MLVVVPGEERLAESAGVLNRAEAIRELGTVFQRPELTFRIGIIVGRVRPAVRLGDTEIGQQESDGLAAHGRTPVGVYRELAWENDLLFTRFLDQLAGEPRAFT